MYTVMTIELERKVLSSSMVIPIVSIGYMQYRYDIA